jgi:hypothetical protein
MFKIQEPDATLFLHPYHVPPEHNPLQLQKVFHWPRQAGLPHTQHSLSQKTQYDERS